MSGDDARVPSRWNFEKASKGKEETRHLTERLRGQGICIPPKSNLLYIRERNFLDITTVDLDALHVSSPLKDAPKILPPLTSHPFQAA